jgi:signal transduction histidine kinase
VVVERYNFVRQGLGLALCKKYIEVLGGRIEVTTQLGIGTTFVIYLPKISDQ